MAQHHGLPTRMTDWTANPLMALFFAVDGPCPVEPTVWIYDVTSEQISRGEDSRYAPPDIELNAIMQPSRHSARVAVQAGWHIIHHFHKDSDGVLRVLALDGMKFHRDRMEILKVEPGKAGAIRSELKQMGIHHATAYGDLGSVCRGIVEWLCRYLP